MSEKKRCLFHSEILLGNLNRGGAHEPAGITHDVGVLIHQEGVVGLDAGGGVGVVGAVPGSLGRELVVSLGDIVDVAQLALTADDIQRVLGQTGSGGVAVGVSPGTEAASAAASQIASSTLARIFWKSPASAVRSMPRAPG